MQTWYVIVEKITTGKRQQRLMVAASADDAGRQTCDLIGGPGTAAYRVVKCTATN
jgi:hypothetical protein